MAVPFAPLSKSAPFSTASLLKQTRTFFEQLRDSRQKARANHLNYAIEDAVLSAFSVFFTQSPSFLDYQIRMQTAHGKNNAQSICGVHQIPSANPIRNLLDPIPPETGFGLLREMDDSLHAHGYLTPFRSIGDTLLVALAGTDFCSSEKISCPCCRCQPLKNGNTLYRHRAVTPVSVAQAHVVPWPPELIPPQEGQEKQDGERAAGNRWLNVWGAHDAPWRITLLGDDLSCHQPFCEEAIAQGFDLLLVCKPDSHSRLYEWVADFERAGPICVVESVRKTGKRRLTERYRYMNRLPLRDSECKNVGRTQQKKGTRD